MGPLPGVTTLQKWEQPQPVTNIGGRPGGVGMRWGDDSDVQTPALSNLLSARWVLVTCLSCALLWPFRFCLLFGLQTSSLELRLTHTVDTGDILQGVPGSSLAQSLAWVRVAQITPDPPSRSPQLRALLTTSMLPRRSAGRALPRERGGPSSQAPPCILHSCGPAKS